MFPEFVVGGGDSGGHYGRRGRLGSPNGLLQLLGQTCRSLSEIALAIDTRGYTDFRESLTSLGLTLPSSFSINVLGSLIEEESVPAAFLATIAPCLEFSFSVGRSRSTGEGDHKAG